MGLGGDFAAKGWLGFSDSPDLRRWLAHAGPLALAARHDPGHAHWLTCEGTWFVGVNALANDAGGAIARSGPLPGPAIGFARETLGFAGDLDRAQVSIAYPGYPRPRSSESEAAFRFRRDRDAAHVDGLHPVGADRRRRLEEFAGFLMGLPVSEADASSAPIAVWEGSHRIMRAMFRRMLAPHPPEDWPQIDLTEAYHAARREAFATCRRVLVHARPGEAYLLHRMALHGMSPWQDGAFAPPEGRVILYFRPEIARTDWLNWD